MKTAMSKTILMIAAVISLAACAKENVAKRTFRVQVYETTGVEAAREAGATIAVLFKDTGSAIDTSRTGRALEIYDMEGNQLKAVQVSHSDVQKRGSHTFWEVPDGNYFLFVYDFHGSVIQNWFLLPDFYYTYKPISVDDSCNGTIAEVTFDLSKDQGYQSEDEEEEGDDGE